MKTLKTKISELENTNAFTSEREITLTLMEVTQDNLFRYAQKLVTTVREGKISNEAFGYYIDEFARYIKEESIDDSLQTLVIQK